MRQLLLNRRRRRWPKELGAICGILAVLAFALAAAAPPDLSAAQRTEFADLAQTAAAVGTGHVSAYTVCLSHSACAATEALQLGADVVRPNEFGSPRLSREPHDERGPSPPLRPPIAGLLV